MATIHYFIKVSADIGEEEDPRKLAAEICRQIERVYGVRNAELSSLHDESEA